MKGYISITRIPLKVWNNTCNNNNRGIFSYFSFNSSIRQNECSSNREGILLYESANSTIEENICNDNFDDNNDYAGIGILRSDFSNVTNNVCNNNKIGIRIHSSENSFIFNNTCDDSEYGFKIFHSLSSVILENRCNNDGFYIYDQTLEDYFSYSIVNNSVNGRKLGYFLNLNNEVFLNQSFGQLILINCTDTAIRDQNFSNVSSGIYLFKCLNSSVVNNTCNNNMYGISLYHSNFSFVNNNTCNNNYWRGIIIEKSGSSIISDNICQTTYYVAIFLWGCDNTIIANNTCSKTILYSGLYLYYSKFAIVENNTCFENKNTGIYIHSSSSNILIKNNNCIKNRFGIGITESNYCNITYNSLFNNTEHGIYLFYSASDNQIHHNMFFFNNLGGSSQANDNGANNIWFDTLLNEGNFWNDHSGVGAYSISGAAKSSDLYPTFLDQDRDGMPDFWETLFGLNVLIDDSLDDLDSDEILNIDEYNLGTFPNSTDTDSDLLPDLWELETGTNPVINDATSDLDGGTLTNYQEFQLGTYANNTDSDGDNMDDGYEVNNSLNPLIDDADGDLDADGLTNYLEYQIGTFANNPDTDSDTLPDGWEYEYDLDPLDASDASLDTDGDGLINIQEYLVNTNPTNPDTDGDGETDGEEVANGFDPLDPDSNYSSYRSSQILKNVLYIVLPISIIVILFFGLRYYRRYLAQIRFSKFGFESLVEMQTAQRRGFNTKTEFDEANSSGFVNFDEYKLAKSLDFRNKADLIASASTDIELASLQVQSCEKRIRNLKEFINIEYDIEQLNVYDANLDEISSELEESIILVEQYKAVAEEKTRELTTSIPRIGHDILKVQIPKLQSEIRNRISYLQNFEVVLELTKKFHPNVPVTLERIATLANLSQKVVETYLRDLTKSMPEIGEFLELEQVFIRQYSDDQDVKSFFNLAREKYREEIIGKSVQPTCIYCQSEFDEIDRTKTTICQNCEKEAPSCPICKQSMFHGEDLVTEKNCGNVFHKDHIVMWIRSEKLCPVCKKRINEQSLEDYEPEQ